MFFPASEALAGLLTDIISHVMQFLKKSEARASLGIRLGRLHTTRTTILLAVMVFREYVLSFNMALLHYLFNLCIWLTGRCP